MKGVGVILKVFSPEVVYTTLLQRGFKAVSAGVLVSVGIDVKECSSFVLLSRCELGILWGTRTLQE